jgi:PAS domain S-box-containing protein
MVQNKTVTLSRKYAESIIDTIREPLIVLDQNLRVVSASRSFYEVFKVKPEETIGQHIYDLGNKQWDIPKLRELLEDILPKKTTFDNYEVEHKFAVIGRRIMLLNARQIEQGMGKERIILLAIEDITERRRLQGESEANEERYRSAFESSHDGLLLVDRSQGDILNSNPSAQELLGYSKEEFLKNKLWGIGVVKDDKDFQEALSRLERDGVIYYDNIPVKNKKGLVVNTEVILVDKVKFIQCNIRDITETKRAEETIRTLVLREEAILLAIPDIIMEVNDKKIYTWANQAGREFFGEDVVGKEASYYFEGPQDTYNVVDPLFKGDEKIVYVDSWQRRKDGEKRLLAWTCCLLKDARGNAAALSSARDITQRKLAEKQITLLAHTLKSVAECVSITDLNDIVLFVNSAFLKTYGYTENEILGKNIKVVRSPTNAPETTRGILAATLEGGWNGELMNRTKDGREFPVLLSTSFVRDERGQDIALVGIATDITERKRVEEELNLAHIELKNLHDTLEEAIFSYDVVKNKMLNVSAAHEAVYGYPTNEFLKNPRLWYELVLPEDRPIVDAGFVVLMSGKNHQHEVRIVYVDGHVRWIEAKMKPTLDQNGKLIHIDGIVTNITERKRAEEELRETSDYLENLLSFANAPIMVWDNKNKITRFNLAFERMTGYTMYDVVGKNPEILFPDDKREDISALISSTSDGENLISVELPVRCKNGITRIVLWNTSNVYTKDAKTIIATIAHGQDITERKRAEEAMQESELRFRSLYENATIGIYRTTPEGAILLANPALVKMLGYTSFQTLAERNLEKDGFEPSSQRKECLDKIERDGEVKGYDSKWIRQDGTAVFVLESARAIRDAQGKTLYYDGTVEDITERKQLEEGLRQMQKLEGLGTLAGGIAHDFNNILGIILAYITSTRRFKDDAEKLDLAVDTIVKAVERGKTLVQQILTFARKTETEFGPVKVNDVAMEVMVMIFETFPKILTYAQNFDKNISYINADRSQLHQLLLNLCVNARDAMPNGGLLTINTRMASAAILRYQHSDAAESNYVCIEVRDTGEGMSPETRRRIFEPFFTTKEPGKGTGLGLAVVFGVVQTHKGFIDVESELGKGTTFSIYLPASQIAEPIIVNKDEASLEETPGGTETLLVAEDEEMLMMTLRMLLVEKGYTVLSAEDGLTAWKIYQERKNDIALVLTDLGLPKMTGMEECVQIKILNPLARIIVATGYLDSGMKSEFLKAGIKHFLFKPYDLKQVLKMVREVIDEK